MQYLLNGTISKINKIYNIKLEDINDFSSKKEELAKLSALSLGGLVSLLETIHAADKNILGCRENSLPAFGKIIQLTSNYPVKSLHQIFKILSKAKLINPELFEKSINLLNEFKSEADRNCFVAFLERWAEGTGKYRYFIDDVFNIKPEGIQLLDSIRKKIGFLSNIQFPRLFSLSNAELKKVETIITILVKAKLYNLENKDLAYSSGTCLWLNHALLCALDASDILTQNILDRIKALQGINIIRSPLYTASVPSQETLIALENFIPCIINLSYKQELTYPVLNEILSDIENLLQSAEYEITCDFLKKETPLISDFDSSFQESNPKNTIVNTFFLKRTSFLHGNVFEIPSPNASSSSHTPTDLPPPYTPHAFR